MNDLNSLLIEGRLVRDPLSRQTDKGTSVCSFSIATDRYYKAEDGFQKETSFIDIESWGRVAEAVLGDASKGRGVRVTGRLKQERWTAADGAGRSRVVVVADHVEFRPEYAKRAES
jgi:single-strand DNA-binding protein